MLDFKFYGSGIYSFDSGYVRPMLAAIHMIVENERVAFVDTGTNMTLANAISALDKLGLGVEAVDFVILTHIHLDHAGGAGSMMQAFPNARLVVHPRGSRHMADPSRLIAGASAVYGSDYVKQVYGEIIPISAERMIQPKDGEIIFLSGRELMCMDTPGHALHHICIVDARSKSIFTGDMFGISYREMDVGGRQFVFPTTTPSQFDPQAMRSSIRRLLSFSPESMYLTHYSRLNDVAKNGEDLLRRLDFMVEIALAERHAGELRNQKIKDSMMAYLLAEIQEHGCQMADQEIINIWESDIELNMQGLVYWLDVKIS